MLTAHSKRVSIEVFMQITGPIYASDMHVDMWSRLCSCVILYLRSEEIYKAHKENKVEIKLFLMKKLNN
jgi:hypothetical protein